MIFSHFRGPGFSSGFLGLWLEGHWCQALLQISKLLIQVVEIWRSSKLAYQNITNLGNRNTVKVDTGVLLVMLSFWKERSRFAQLDLHQPQILERFWEPELGTSHVKVDSMRHIFFAPENGFLVRWFISFYGLWARFFRGKKTIGC